MKNKIITSLIILIFILMIATSVNAAIEIKPGTTTHTNITVSNSYQYCYNMRNPTSSLGNNTLDPHLSLNRDWGAVTYLGLSGYGSIDSDTPDTTTVNGTSYTTTNGNPTGVLNLGKIGTFTSYVPSEFSDDRYTQMNTIVENKNSQYVEIMSASNTNETTRGQSIAEVWGWYGGGQKYPDTFYPAVERLGMIGLGNWDGWVWVPCVGKGEAHETITYRPVLWN